MSIRVVDAGNFQQKIVSENGVMMIPSDITTYYDRDLDEELFGKYDLIVEYEGKKYFAGTLAQVENQFSDFGETTSMFGMTKAHEDAKLRTLIGLALSDVIGNVQLVVGQPIKSHKKSEKEKIKQMLLGNHKIIINDQTYQFDITKVAVGTEGSSAYFAIDKDVRDQHEVVRIIDAGSGTVNLATIYQGKKTSKGSTTLKFGKNTITTSVEEFAKAIIRDTTKIQWNKNDQVFVCGGSAYDIINTVQDHFENAMVIKPKVQVGNGVKRVHPVYSNAVGFYEIARGLFK